MKKADKPRGQKKPRGNRVQKLSSGFLISTYKEPPEGFLPAKATTRELLVYGFPRKPDPKKEPQLRAIWDKVFSKPRRMIVPQFIENVGKTHGHARKSKLKGGSKSGGIANATSGNWSGAVQFAQNNTAFSWVAGQWTVPNPHTSNNGSYYASEWVGIDGWGSNDVCQAGTETEVSKILWFSNTNVYTWWEWFPSNEVAITNLPVSAGDVMYCLICLTSTTTATIYFTNQSTGDMTRFDITAPSGTTLVGNSAEWIVERPSINNTPTSLSDFGVVYFDECLAFCHGTGGRFVDNLNSATPITMTGAGGAALSTPVIENSSVLKLTWRKSS